MIGSKRRVEVIVFKVTQLISGGAHRALGLSAVLREVFFKRGTKVATGECICEAKREEVGKALSAL